MRKCHLGRVEIHPLGGGLGCLIMVLLPAVCR